MVVFAQLHSNTRKEIGLKLGKERWYDHVKKSAEKSRKSKATLLWNQRVQRTEPSSQFTRHHSTS